MTDPGDALRTALHDPLLDRDMGGDDDPVALLSGVLDRRDRLRRRRQRVVVGAAAAAAVLVVGGTGVAVGMIAAAGPTVVAPASPIPAPGQVGLIDPPTTSLEPTPPPTPAPAAPAPVFRTPLEQPPDPAPGPRADQRRRPDPGRQATPKAPPAAPAPVDTRPRPAQAPAAPRDR